MKNPEAMLAKYLVVIDRTVQSAGRRASLDEEAIADLVADVRVRFIENDYHVLQSWSTRASMATYIVSHALRFALEAIRAQGQYTVPAEALLGGPMAVLLDQLVRREGLSPAEAAELVRDQFPTGEPEEVLIGLAEGLGSAHESTQTSRSQLNPDEELIEELDVRSHSASHEVALARALSSLSAVDQLVIVWRFWEGIPAMEIGQRLGIEPEHLYTRMEQLLGRLRRELQSSGVDAESAMALLAWSGWSFKQLVGDTEPPREIITLARELSDALIRDFRTAPERLYDLHPRQFEELIAELLASYGWRVTLTPRTRDGGYDLFAISRDVSGVETSWLVECKRYRQDRPVGIEIVRALYGVKHDVGAANALLATTSRFSRDVYAYKASRYDLELRDYEGILEWINEYRPHPLGQLYIKDRRLEISNSIQPSSGSDRADTRPSKLIRD